MFVLTARCAAAGRRRRYLMCGAAALIALCCACSQGGALQSPTTLESPATTHSVSQSSASASASVSTPPAQARPWWQHVVVVVEENRSYADIVGNPSAPYLNHLASTGTSFTRLSALTHPSQPNYVALFSGSRQGLTDDSCPHTFNSANLATQLRRAGYTFAGYAESLPSVGFRGCATGAYLRRHCPWINFTDVPRSASRPLTSLPTDFGRLPSLSFVIPNVDHDMHDGTIGQADTWLRTHLAAYASWAAQHRSLLIVTWDEDDGSVANHIPTIVTGAGVPHSPSAQPATLYSLLRTLEDSFALPALGEAARARTLTALEP
jgi:hypothetical protein